MKAFLILVGALTACRYHVVAGPPQPPDSTAPDPPGRVARLSLIRGTVSFQPAGTSDWALASLNRPLTSGDSLWAAEDAQAELTLGTAAIRMGPRTGIGILNLDDRTVQIKVTQGTFGIHVRNLEADEAIEIDTPDAAVSLLRTGQYRADVDSATSVIVRSGMAEISTGPQPAVLASGKLARITTAGIGAPEPAPPLDSFDAFCEERERRASARAASLQHVRRDVIGWEDLDDYGDWQVAADYGPVWSPRGVAPGWVPYRFGHWVWIEPWGWTWIDDAPWGFAPFHYGRWIYWSARWCWVPGPVRIRVVYAPALVVFVGGRAGVRYHVRIGIGIGVGWFPLGPHEVYLPPYHSSRRYITAVNVGHTVIRDPDRMHAVDMSKQRYRNREVTGAITAAPEDDFIGGRPIARVARPMTEREAADLQVRGTAAPVAPVRRSLGVDPDAPRAAPRPPPSVSERRVTVRRAPAPPQPDFDQRRPQLEANPGVAPPPAGRRESRETAQPGFRRIPETAREQPAPQPRVEQPRAAPQPSSGEIRRQDQRRREIEQEHRRQQPQQQPAAQTEQRQRKSEPEERGGRKPGEQRTPRGKDQ